MSAQDDVAEFAALLRELKERTDRSYGSLARRLDMNTSTLHRYCAGDAVPVDFAPVERFAALCGASRAERLDLHHRWLRAVETRRRPPGPGAPATPRTPPATSPPPGTGPAPGCAPGSDTGDLHTVARGRVDGVAPDAPVAGHDTAEQTAAGGAAPDGPSGPGTGSGSFDRSGPGPGAGAGGSGHASGPVAGSGVVSGPSVGEVRARRPWYRRRERVAVALAAACALLATVGSLSTLPDDRQASGSGPVDAPPVTSAASGSAEAPRGRTSSPSPSSSPSATAKSGPSSPEARRETGAPSAPAESDAPVGAPPLTWSADSHVWAYGCGHDYVVAEPPERVPPPPAPQDAGTWAATQSAVHGGETLVELSVQGTSDTAVVLTALRVRVAGRSDPAPGNAYAMDQGCGGALTPRSFDVDLDKDRPIARAVAGNDAGTPIPAVRMPYRVSATDPEVLRVTARTADCDCRWYLELDWSSQGRTGTVRVDDHGRPFRTSGIGGLPHYEYDTSARGWKPRIQ
ncbi:hypothetical protein AMK33_02805 [Streptomyces sp. CB02400]|nr:helix-turn-helix transcriptional regulator [Streptomyces sp. CB02400]OKK14205.1 hypothetical protein AMK33_02805 [Streptomyces sp. CB02400]